METVTLSNPTSLINDKREDGWKLIEDVPLEGTPTLELVEFRKDGEDYVNGETMLSRAKELGNMAGQRHAERLLSMASQIPKSWRDFYLVFPGTVWQDTDGNRNVPYLYWSGGEWNLDWSWLSSDWSRDYRVVRLGK